MNIDILCENNNNCNTYIVGNETDCFIIDPSNDIRNIKKLVNNPCEEYAIEYIEHRKNKPTFSFTYSNHPSVWASLREKWNVINKSDRISYEMKKAIMDDLMWQGLHLNNQKIIDNYKGNKNDTGR